MRENIVVLTIQKIQKKQRGHPRRRPLQKTENLTSVSVGAIVLSRPYKRDGTSIKAPQSQSLGPAARWLLPKVA